MNKTEKQTYKDIYIFGNPRQNTENFIATRFGLTHTFPSSSAFERFRTKEQIIRRARGENRKVYSHINILFSFLYSI